VKVEYVAYSDLSPAQDADLAILMGLCEAEDKASTCLGFNAYLNYDKSMPSYVLAREEGPRGRLIGAATLFAPMKEEAELSACVLPEFRRRGVYGGLLSEVRGILSGRGVGRLLYVLDRASASGSSMLAGRGFSLHHSEYSMRFRPSEPHAANRAPLPAIELRRADFSDMDALVAMGASGFGDMPEEARSFITAHLESPDHEQYIALAGTRAAKAAVPVAMVSLGRASGGETSINGLCVTPGRRGEGFGRAVMTALLDLLIARGEGPIVLDVDSENEVAHRLYLSLGFGETQTVDYYLEEL
jgi:ribosomal protein S18 acetylase RimI-like enzyme